MWSRKKNQGPKLKANHNHTDHTNHIFGQNCHIRSLWCHPSRSVQHPSRPHGAIRKASLLLRRGKRDWALLGYARRRAPRGSSSFFGECTAPPFEVRGAALLEVPAGQTLRPNFFVDDFFKHSYYLLTCYSCWHIITVTAKKVRSIREDKLSMK